MKIKRDAIRQRFFKNLVACERLKVFQVFGILGAEEDGSSLNHSIERKLLDRVLGDLEEREENAVDIGALKEQSEAWNAVADILTQVRPGWQQGVGTGMQCAVNTIRELAGKQPEPAVPEGQKVVDTFLKLQAGTERPYDVVAGALLLTDFDESRARSLLQMASDEGIRYNADVKRQQMADAGFKIRNRFVEFTALDADQVEQVRAALRSANLQVRELGDSLTNLAAQDGIGDIPLTITPLDIEAFKAASETPMPGVRASHLAVELPNDTKVSHAFAVPIEGRPAALHDTYTPSAEEDLRTAHEAFIMTERTLIKRMRDRAHAAKIERDDVLCTDLTRGADRMHAKLGAFMAKHKIEGI